MKKHWRLILKQSLKYLVILIIAFLGMALYRMMWDIPKNAFYWSVGVVVAIILALSLFDAFSVKDVISIFKG